MKTLIMRAPTLIMRKKKLISEKLKNQQLGSIRELRSQNKTVIQETRGKSKYRESWFTRSRNHWRQWLAETLTIADELLWTNCGTDWKLNSYRPSIRAAPTVSLVLLWEQYQILTVKIRTSPFLNTYSSNIQANKGGRQPFWKFSGKSNYFEIHHTQLYKRHLKINNKE